MRNIKEVWKSIDEYDGYYKVSNLGRVKSIKRAINRADGSVRTFRGCIRKLLLNRYGYPVVYITYGNRLKPKLLSVHRLVAQAFIPNPFKKETVNHIDGNPSNNNVENLEWMTGLENIRHAYKNGFAKGRPEMFKTVIVCCENCKKIFHHKKNRKVRFCGLPCYYELLRKKTYENKN